MPISIDAMFLFPDTPIFTDQEREGLETNQYLRPYSGITKNHLVGLLHALGEYGMRTGWARVLLTEMVPGDAGLVERHEALVDCWRQLRKGYLTGIASRDEFVFDAQERRKLSLMKYVRGCEHLNKPEVIGVLEVLGRYSVQVPKLQAVFGPLSGHMRAIHAHNALVAFRDQPFSFPDYVRSLHAARKEAGDVK